MIGYEQGYISGIEIGRKGPPNEEFIDKLIAALNLDPNEQSALRKAVKESERRYTLPQEVPVNVYRMMHELWLDVENLHPVQIRMIRDILRLRDQLSLPSRPGHGGYLEGVQLEEERL